MTVKEELKTKFKGQELTLKELYNLMPEIKQHQIRSVLNACIKADTDFIRVSKGKYKVK